MSGIYLTKRKLIYCAMKCFSLSNLRNIETIMYYCLQERIAIRIYPFQFLNLKTTF